MTGDGDGLLPPVRPTRMRCSFATLCRVAALALWLFPFCGVAQEPAAQNNVVLRSALAPLPNLRERGQRVAGSIRVTVYGTVRRPGIYYLPEGSVLGEALAIARTNYRRFWWGLSRLTRIVDEEHAEIIRFKRGGPEPEQIPLKEGDCIYLGYEVY